MKDHAEIDLPRLHAFLTGTLAPLYARQVTDIPEATWCPDWWAHPEAVERLELLRQLRGAAGRDPELLSEWWELHAAPHMAALLNPAGTFKFCSVRHGHSDMLVPLPCNAPPATALSAAA